MAVFSSIGVGNDDAPMCSFRLVFFKVIVHEDGVILREDAVIVNEDVLTKATLFVASACEKATWEDQVPFDPHMLRLKDALKKGGEF